MTMTTAEDRAGAQPATEPDSNTQPASGRHHRRGAGVLRALRTFVVTLALFAAAAAGGVYIAHHRLQAQAYVDLGTAMLTAEAVPVGSPNAAVVTGIRVGEQAHVKAGQVLAVVSFAGATPSASATDATGNGNDSGNNSSGNGGGAGAGGMALELRAPIDGTVASVNSAVGSVVKPGEPVVTLYDQSKLTFQADVPVDRLKRLRLGMIAYVDGPGLQHRIQASLARIVPRVGGSPLSGTDQLTVVLVPLASAQATVSTLVPGLPYTATVDTKTSTGGTPAVNSAG